MSKEAMLTAEVAVLTELVRVLSDKVAEMETKQKQGEPACSGCGKTNTPDSQWACYCVDCWTKAQQEQGEPVGTVGELFDEGVIWMRELDRDLLVYIASSQEKNT